MLILNINGKKYKYRSNQSEITLKVGKELEELRKEYDCDCNIQYQRWALTILCGCSYDEASIVEDESLARLIGVHPFFANEIKVYHENYVKINHRLYRYIDFTQPMTVERYGNLDFMAMIESFDDLYLSLYQPLKRLNLKYWLRYFLLKNHKSIADINYFRYKIALYLYFKYKSDLLIEYGLSVADDGIPQDQKPDPYVLTELEKYGLYHTIMELCEDDYDKQETWLKRDIRELFKYLRYINKKTMIYNQTKIQ